MPMPTGEAGGNTRKEAQTWVCQEAGHGQLGVGQHWYALGGGPGEERRDKGRLPLVEHGCCIDVGLEGLPLGTREYPSPNPIPLESPPTWLQLSMPVSMPWKGHSKRPYRNCARTRPRRQMPTTRRIWCCSVLNPNWTSFLAVASMCAVC